MVNPTVVAVYALTLGATEEAKDSSYDAIQDAVDRVPTGDWNARPGALDKATRHILGKFTLSTKCASDDCQVNFASPNRNNTTTITPPCDMVLQRRTHQEPNLPHDIAVPRSLLRDRLPGKQWGPSRQ